MEYCVPSTGWRLSSSARRAVLLEERGTESKNASFLGFWTSPGNCSRPSRERMICSLHASTGNLNGPPGKAYEALAARPEARGNSGLIQGPHDRLGPAWPSPFLPSQQQRFLPIPSRPRSAKGRASGPTPPSLLPRPWPMAARLAPPRPALFFWEGSAGLHAGQPVA